MPSNETLKEWFAEGQEMGATHVMEVTDTFPMHPKTEPRFIMPGEKMPEQGYFPGAMEGRGSVYDLSQPVESYFVPDHIRHGCPHIVGPCGCG